MRNERPVTRVAVKYKCDECAVEETQTLDAFGDVGFAEGRATWEHDWREFRHPATYGETLHTCSEACMRAVLDRFVVWAYSDAVPA